MHTPDHVIQHLAELANFACGRVPSPLDSNPADVDQRSQDATLEEYVERLGALTAVATAVGAIEVLKVCPFAERNLAAFRARMTPLAATEWTLLADWPTRVLDYLLQPDQPEIAFALVDHLSDPHWPRAVEWIETMAILPAGAPTDARERNVDDAAVTDRHHATNLNEPNR
ncbi:MAG: hypothetical protein ACKVQT_00995, partial [Burkholderiales bacterium]